MEEARIESWVCPCFGDQAGARSWSNCFGPFGEFPVVLRGKKAVLDRELTNCNLQNLIVSDFFHHWGGWMIVAIIVVLVCHCVLPPSRPGQLPTGSSQRSGDSVCKVSLSNGYSSQRSFCRNLTM